MIKRNELTATICAAALLITASVAPAATLTFDPDAGNFLIAGGGTTSIGSLNGVLYSAGNLTDSNTVREVQVYGDMTLNAGDVIQAVMGSTNAVRFVVGGNVNIAPGAILKFGAQSNQACAGGGGPAALGGAGGAVVVFDPSGYYSAGEKRVYLATKDGRAKTALREGLVCQV